MKQRHILTTLLLLATLVLRAQEVEKEEKKFRTAQDQAKVMMICFSYAGQWPFGHMQERFGYNNNVGFALNYKMKRNFTIGAEGNFLFGEKVRESGVLSAIATSTGEHISVDGSVNTISLAERGWQMKVLFGKIIPLSSKLLNTGIYLQTGLGFLQHKIYINVREERYPQLDKTYRKGYDRLTNGFCISQLIGGVFLRQKSFISLYGGFNVDVAFTKNRRNWNFDLHGPDNRNRVDVLLGFKLCWVIPVFLKENEQEEKFYYY